MTDYEPKDLTKLELQIQENSKKSLERTDKDSKAEVLEHRNIENELRGLQDKLELEIRNINLLHTLSTYYIESEDLDLLFSEIVKAAIAITGTNKGNIQLLDPSTGKLKIAALIGFSPSFLKFFESVTLEEITAFRAAQKIEHIIVENITQSPIFLESKSLDMFLNEGIKAAQSTPVVSRSGQFLGLISVYFSQIHFPDEHELKLINILARQAADIIERKQAEEKLHETENRLLVAKEAADLGIYDYNPDSNSIHWDERIRELWGVDPDEPVTYDTFMAGIHPDDRAATQKAVDKALDPSGNGKYYAEYRVINRKDKMEHWIAADGQAFFESGSPVRLVGIVQEISDRKKIEETLRAREELLRTVVENSRDGINMLDLETGRYVFMSPAQVAMTGFTAEEINNISAEEAYERVYPEDRELSVSQQKLVAAGIDTKNTVEYRWKVKNGEYRWFSDSRKLVRNTRGLPVALVGVSRDITERKKAEKTLKENEEKKAFLLKLSDAIRPLSDAVEIQATITRITMDYFGADRCYYCEFKDDNAIIRQDASLDDLPSVVGVYSLSSLPIFKTVVDAGNPFVVPDVNTTELIDEELRQLCIQMKIISYIDVPVIKDGKPVGILCITQCSPRNWTDFEVDLAVETAERTWEAVKRAQIENTLHEKQAIFQNFYDSAPFSIGIGELDGKKLTALSANRMTAELFRMNPEDITGKSGLELGTSEDIEHLWVEKIQRSQIEGIPINFEYMDSRFAGTPWLSATVSIIGAGSSGKFLYSFIVEDITERKQEERKIQRYNAVLEGINQIFASVVKAETEEALGTACLSVALDVTGSEVGFIGKINADECLHDIVISKGDWDNYFVYDSAGHRCLPENFVIHKICGRAIDDVKGSFMNNLSPKSNINDLPQDHPQIMSFLCVPLFLNGKLAGIIGVANRKNGYNWEQQADLESIAIAVTQALERKKEEKERERAEKQLFTTNQRLRALMNSLPVGVSFSEDPSCQKVTGNPVLLAQFEVNPEDNLSASSSQNDAPGRKVRYFLNGKQIRETELPLQRAVAENRETTSMELEIELPSGKRWIAEASAAPIRDEQGNVIGGVAVTVDITARKRAEEKLKKRTLQLEKAYKSLKQNQESLAEAQRIAHIGNWEWDIVDNKVYWSEEMYHIFGLNPKEPAPGYDEFLNFIHPEDQDCIDKIVQKRLEGFFDGIDYRIILANGEERTVYTQSEAIFNENNIPIKVKGIVQDITERKKAEEKLRESEEKYRNIIETTNEGIVVIDSKLHITYVNKKLLENTGYIQEEVIGRSYSDFVDKESKAIAQIHIDKRRQGIDEVYELKLIRKDDSPFWVLISAKALFDKDGQFAGSLTMFTDITERKKTEEKLKKRTFELEEAYKSLIESEKSLSEAQKMAHIGNWDWDLVDGKVYWSKELYNIFGRDPHASGATYDELLNYIHSEDRTYVKNAIEMALKGKPYSVDYRIILANGEERTLHAQSKVIFNEKSIPIRAKGILQDITESTKARERIKILADAVESSNDAIVTETLEGTITSWNKGAEQIYGYLAEEILGKDVSILEPANLKGETSQLIELIKKREKVSHYETLRLKKDNTLINVSVTFSPIFNVSGEIIAISGISRDITERKKAEESLAKIEAARLKEIHHRIKNNLQVISSLLDLQAEKFMDEKVLEAFKESQNRVISMSLIHEELYKGEGTHTLNFSTYLQKLIENLFQTYSLRSKNIHLSMNLEENTFFDMDLAVPLGIIVNELISNSLKHAFSENKRGELRIKLSKEKLENRKGKSLYSLIISDNGKGIPENIVLGNFKSLGLQLVNALIDQLDGKIEIKRNQGTEFRISFDAMNSE